MIELIKKLCIKYKSIIIYGITGVLTTILNIACYLLCYRVIGISNVPSNIIAWFVAVIFAFFTNKFWVFGSRSTDFSVMWSEFLKFTAARLATGALDTLIMYIGVDLMHGNETLFKVGSNILVIILNYVFSKLIVFRSKGNGESPDSTD